MNTENAQETTGTALEAEVTPVIPTWEQYCHDKLGISPNQRDTCFDVPLENAFKEYEKEWENILNDRRRLDGIGIQVVNQEES